MNFNKKKFVLNRNDNHIIKNVFSSGLFRWWFSDSLGIFPLNYLSLLPLSALLRSFILKRQNTWHPYDIRFCQRHPFLQVKNGTTAESCLLARSISKFWRLIYPPSMSTHGRWSKTWSGRLRTTNPSKTSSN